MWTNKLTEPVLIRSSMVYPREREKESNVVGVLNVHHRSWFVVTHIYWLVRTITTLSIMRWTNRWGGILPSAINCIIVRCTRCTRHITINYHVPAEDSQVYLRLRMCQSRAREHAGNPYMRSALSFLNSNYPASGSLCIGMYCSMESR